MRNGITTRFHGHSLAELRDAVAECRACPLWARATRAVPGEGNERARIMLVGEQPGDQEDLSGHPFVARPESCSMRRWLPPASIARRCSSPTSSSTSAGFRAASGGCTRRRRNRRWRHVSIGCRRRCLAGRRQEFRGLQNTAASAAAGQAWRLAVRCPWISCSKGEKTFGEPATTLPVCR